MNTTNDQIPCEGNFTPRLGQERVVMQISDSDKRLITRGPGFKGIVYDEISKAHYEVWGRSCGLPRCYCDAEVKTVKVTKTKSASELLPNDITIWDGCTYKVLNVEVMSPQFVRLYLVNEESNKLWQRRTKKDFSVGIVERVSQ